MDLKLKGKRALVMGASTGLGKAIAETLVKEGAEVAICSRSLEKLKATAQSIGCQHYFTCDLSKPGEAKKVVEKALLEMKGLDILVTNTGGPKKGNFLEVSEAQWQEDFQSLWMSVVESLKVALPSMKENNFGRILLVTSLAAKEPLSGLTTSNGLRAGLPGLCKSIANEYSAFGITLNLLLPGYTNTDRLKNLKLSEDKIKQLVPAGRLGEPQELADLAAFLASPRAGYITGQSIVIDGGALKGH
jgi:3-oxoacyl-[acyl-carrier protein] reductase